MKIRNIVVLSLLSLIIAGGTFYGCKRKKETYIGPEYLSAPAGFSGSIASLSDNVDFTIDSCYLLASFSDRVTYTVTYKGLSSGATKSFTNVGSGIASNEIGNIWNGSNDGINLFRSGEEVEMTISFFRSEYTLKDTMTILTKKNFFSNPNYLPLYAANNGYEGATANNFPGQFYFLSAAGCSGVSAINSTIGAPEGLKCFQIESKSCQADGYFIGGMQHRKTGFHMPSTWLDPNQIYLNLYVYGEGKANGRFSLEFHEADLANDVTKPKGECKPPLTLGGTTIAIGEHDPCSDDGWIMQIPMNHIGWKLVSVKFSDFVRSGSLPNGGNGNGIKEPGRIHRIQIGVLSVPTPGEKINAVWDFPVLSYGAPFDPSK